MLTNAVRTRVGPVCQAESGRAVSEVFEEMCTYVCDAMLASIIVPCKQLLLQDPKC